MCFGTYFNWCCYGVFLNAMNAFKWFFFMGCLVSSLSVASLYGTVELLAGMVVLLVLQRHYFPVKCSNILGIGN